MLIFGISVLIYFFLHSFLAANAVKKYLLERFISERFYRLGYNAMAVILLIPLLILFLRMEQQAILEISKARLLPAGLLLASGMIWIIRALAGYDLGEFSGMAQWRTGKPPEHTALKINGLNRLVRHPLYFGMLQSFLGVFLLFPTDAVLLLVMMSIAYLVLGARLEERKLTEQFGEAYLNYKKTTPMLLPFKFSRRRI